jgi:hypothetical protein
MHECYGLVLPFDSDDPLFRRGFEAGTIWIAALALPYPGDYHECAVHADNTEMIIRIAETLGLKFSGESMGDDWLAVRLERLP